MLARFHTWFDALLPPLPLVATTHQRERHRKSRVLAIVSVVDLVLVIIPVVSYAVAGPWIGEVLLWLGILLSAGILWLNRRGHYEIAALAYLLLLFVAVLGFTVLVHPQGVGALWVIFLALPTFVSGLFLNAWVPWIFGGLSSGVLFLVWQFPQLLPWFKSRTLPPTIYASLYFLLLVIALVSSLYAWSLERAVRQADRTEELEGANRHLRDANTELTALRDTLAQQNTQLRSANDQLSALAITDPLTGLHNHRFFQEMLGSELATAAGQSLPVALLLLDIDHFRQFNETYGHDVGDRVLKIVAQTIGQDIQPGEHAARYGGEEFVVILPGTDGTRAQTIAERLREGIARSAFVVELETMHLTVSIGVACFPQHASVAASLLKAADLALYAAKRHGRNSVCLYTPQLFEQQAPFFSPTTPLHLPSGADWETVQALITAIDLRDGYTAAHSEGVARNAVAIGTALDLPTEQIEALRLGGLIHDVGKIGISDEILRKPGRLTADEWQEMQAHTTMGEHILRSVEGLHYLIPLARSHHERLDGSGYPDGLRDEEIPLLVRIISVADVFDAYTSERPYHAGRSTQQGLAILQEEVRMGRLDGAIVRLFITLLAQQLALVSEELLQAA